MKLVSWNVNGIRACAGKGFMDFFNDIDADILCIQETKMQEGQLKLDMPGYHQFWYSADKKGYSGTAVFTKQEPISVEKGMGIDIHDHEGRLIKLDMGFVQKLGENKKYNNIVMSIIELAHRLDMKVVAEGVETKEQADYLKEYGCDYLQGFYFSKPLPEEEFAKLLD